MRQGQRLLFEDETKLCLCPDRGTDYHVRGEQTRVASPGRSVARWLFGTVDVLTGEGLYQIFEQATSAEFLRHLGELLQLFPNERLRLVTDRASYHDSDAVRDFLAHLSPRLELVWLPTHSPHLNAIERLWNYLRANVTRNLFWGTIARQCEMVRDFLAALDLATFQTLMSSSPCLAARTS
jgi:transposase